MSLRKRLERLEDRVPAQSATVADLDRARQWEELYSELGRGRPEPLSSQQARDKLISLWERWREGLRK